MNLSTKLPLTPETCREANLTSKFTSDDLGVIGRTVVEGYEKDLASRSGWESRTQAGMDLALQIVKAKSFPWPNAANVAFPLVTIAATQFHSRAYPSLISGPEIVKARVVGDDPDGSQKARALRIGCHMSYQLLEEDESWEEQHDRLLVVLPIVGCAFKKTYHSTSLGRNCSELVFPKHLVLDYYAKSVDSCARKTHTIPVSRNEMHEKMVAEVYRDCLEEPWFKSDAVPHEPSSSDSDSRQGVSPPQSDESTPFTVLEQHCWMDFDKDGYAEPYIIEVEAEHQQVLRIVARWSRPEDVKRVNGRVLRIVAEEYFTKYGLIPSADGSIYDTGFGVLLGPLNETVNSLVNQLLDAGTMATTAGGFLGRGAKIRGGVYTFAPNEWKRVDSTGDDLSKSVYPLPIREPSPVLFNLLSLIINYTERISGSTDMMVGENPGQNTPAETSRTMVEQGMKIYTAIFKRVWRSMKAEFKKLYVLNGLYLPDSTSYGPQGAKALLDDYRGDPNRVVPAADPQVVSESARVQQAVTIKQSSMQTPGYNKDEVERNLLRALRVEGIDSLFPGSDKAPPGESEKITIEKMKLQAKQMEFQIQQQQFVMELQETARLNTATMLKMQAEVALLMAQAQDQGATTQVTAMQAMISARKNDHDALMGQIEAHLRAIELQQGWKSLQIDEKALEVKKKEPAHA